MRADVKPKKIRYWIPILLFFALTGLFLSVNPLVTFTKVAVNAFIHTHSVTLSAYRLNSTDYHICVPGYCVDMKTPGLSINLGDGDCIIIVVTGTGQGSINAVQDIQKNLTQAGCMDLAS